MDLSIKVATDKKYSYGKFLVEIGKTDKGADAFQTMIYSVLSFKNLRLKSVILTLSPKLRKCDL